MSEIKRALERAKSEKPRNDVFSDGNRPVSLGNRFSAEPENGRAGDIAFVETRVVKTSPEDLARNRITAIDENSGAADQFKLLRTRIFHWTRSRGLNSIQVTGFGAAEGKSTVAANLAVSIAQDTRQTTLLVDLDFRRPSVERLFGLPSGCPGLNAYFLDDTPLERLFVSPGIKKLTLLPAGGPLSNAADILGSKKMEQLVTELKHRYRDRYIIFDTPGVSACPDPLIVSEYMDGILLVARAGCTTRESAAAGMERIPKGKVLGVVMNEYSLPEGTASYRYSGSSA
ncbi:MAG: hypothetical protein LLG06_15640 [Desulfobacteraceae bacterium]|nr:hypothetical protein [Desulfobacteraceae bacterium]